MAEMSTRGESAYRYGGESSSRTWPANIAAATAPCPLMIYAPNLLARESSPLSPATPIITVTTAHCPLPSPVQCRLPPGPALPVLSTESLPCTSHHHPTPTSRSDNDSSLPAQRQSLITRLLHLGLDPSGTLVFPLPPPSVPSQPLDRLSNMDPEGEAGSSDPRNQQVDNAIRAIQEKKPLPEIDFTMHTMEDGTQVNTQERVCKGM